MYVTWLVHTCDMPCSYVWHDSFINWYDGWLMSCPAMCDMTRLYVWHDSFTRVTWFVYELVRWLTHFVSCNVWYDSFICVDMTCLSVWHGSFTCVTWLVDICDMARLWTGTIGKTHRVLQCVPWLIHMCDMTRLHVLVRRFTCMIIVYMLIHICICIHIYIYIQMYN